MTPDKVADAVERVGTLAHIWVEGDHGKWKVTIGWGGAGVFVGSGATEAEAYRDALNKIIKQESSTPGLHNLAAAVTPGMLGLPAKCRSCPTMQAWEMERTTTDWMKQTPTEGETDSD